MQQKDKKLLQFKNALGEIVKELRTSKTNLSINKLALGYDIGRGNLSKIEKGCFDYRMSTAWKLSEALGLKFSKFSEKLEEKLGKDFTFIDE